MGIAGFLVSIALVVIYRRFVQKRPLWGPEAYRFPEARLRRRAYRERLQRAGIDPERSAQQMRAPRWPHGRARGAPAPAAATAAGDDPTENPAHYLRLLEELHDNGVLTDDEYTTVAHALARAAPRVGRP